MSEQREAGRWSGAWRRRGRAAFARYAVPALIALAIMVIGAGASLASWRAAQAAESARLQARFESAGRALQARLQADADSAFVLARALAAASRTEPVFARWRELLGEVGVQTFGVPLRAAILQGPQGSDLLADLTPAAAPQVSATEFVANAAVIADARSRLDKAPRAQAAGDGLAVFGVRAPDGTRVLLAVDLQRWLDVRAAAVADLAAVRLLAPGPDGRERIVGTSAAFPAQTAHLEVGFIGNGAQRWALELAQLGRASHLGYGRLVAGLLASLALGLLAGALLQRQRVAEVLARRMTRQLATSHERYRRAMEASEDGIWTADAATRTVRLSQGGLRLLGLPEEVERHSWRALLSRVQREDRHLVALRVREFVRRGGALDCECRLKPTAGAAQWIRLRGARPPSAGARERVGSISDVSPHRRSEQQLKRYQDFLARVLDAVPIPLVVRERGDEVLLANQAYLDFSGRSREQVLREPFEEPLRELAKEPEEPLQGDAAPLETWGILPSGRPAYIRSTRTRCDGPQGTPTTVATYLDLTVLQEAVAAERNTNARMDGIYRHAPVGLAILSTEGRFLQANPRFCEMVGRDESGLRRLTFQDITPASYHARDQQMFEQMLAEGRCGPFDKVYAHAEGHAVPVRLTGVLVRAGEDRPPLVLAIVDDISHELATRRALGAAERRWQFALTGSGDGVWDWDVGSGRVYYSPQWKRLLGHEEDEVGEQLEEWSQRLHPEDRERALREVERALTGESAGFAVEQRMRHRDGSWIWMLGRGQVVERAADTSPLRLIGTLTDIGVVKRAQEELQRHRSRLAELVQEQTADLIAARDAAEAAHRAKSLFLVNISHELRTPLHAVLSFARLGEARAEQLDGVRLRDYFGRIATGGERLLGLLNDLLDLARLEAGRMPMEAADIDLAALVCDTLGEFEAAFIARRLQAELCPVPALPAVRGDALRIAQVLRNLLSNAIKYSPEERRVTLSLAAVRMTGEQGQGEAVELVMADEGVGIPEGELERVFETFVQSSRTTTGAGGAGLGLAICREIVTAHGGQLFARHNAAGGTDFVLRLPATRRSGPTEDETG